MPAIPMSMNAVVAASRIMLKVAHADGVHPAEVALIRSFYTSSAEGGGWPDFDKLLQESSGGFKVDPQAFASDLEREMIVGLCVMTGFADGSFSATERAVVKAIAAELNIAPERYEEVVEFVKDHMLAQLSHLPDAASVARVARELG
jgi:uncharacterized tellurite resistance protein B-like protein